MSANAAGIVSVDGGFERSVLRGWFGVRFHREALHGLQSRGNGFLIRLGPSHLRIEPLVDLSQSGIVRPDARQIVRDFVFYFGILLRRSRSGLLDWFLVSVHDSDRRCLGHSSASGFGEAGYPGESNLSGGKTRSYPLPRLARRCTLRDDTAKCEQCAARCGHQQAPRSARSKDYARVHRSQ